MHIRIYLNKIYIYEYTHICAYIYVYVFDIYKRLYKFAISISKQKDSGLNYFVLNVRPLSFHNFRQLIMFSELQVPIGIAQKLN